MTSRFSWRRLAVGLLGTFAFGLVIWSGIAVHSAASLTVAEPVLPPAQKHALPETLLNWRDRSELGDYFDQLESLEFGALVWSSFPVQVYIEPSPHEMTLANEDWMRLAQNAVEAWQPFLPLQITQLPDAANITIRAVAPPLQVTPQDPPIPGETPRLALGRVRSAEARYQLYLKTFTSGKTQLIHRCTININPRQAHDYLYAALLHEFGHVLGLWGHSRDPKDTMYFSQVQQPTGISERDVNTLKRVYQQPTQLGWYLP